MSTLAHLSRGMWRLTLAHLRHRRFPLNVIWAITNRCDLNCYYCYGEYGTRRGEREFTLAEITGILDTLHRMGTVFIQLMGGEPLLRDDIGEIVAHCRKRGFHTDLLTNGMRLPERLAAVREVDSICLSLDGQEESTDRNRGRGVFKAVLRAIQLCRTQRIPVRLNAVLTDETTDADLAFLFSLARRERLLLNFCPSFAFVPRAAASPPAQLRVADARMRAMLHQIITARRQGAPVQFSEQAHQLAATWPFSYAKQTARAAELPATYRPFPCRHGDFVVMLDADGRLYPCCNMWNTGPLVNVHDSGFAAAYARLARRDCAACYICSYVDRNGLLALNPRVLASYFRAYVLERMRG